MQIIGNPNDWSLDNWCSLKGILERLLLLQVLTGSDVAVRMALGETQIVSDTRQFLLNNGVLLDAFNQVMSVSFVN